MTLLARTTASLPSRWYYDPAQYARELEAIWYRDWVCVGRSEDLSAAGDFFVAGVGDESLVVTRDLDGRPRAFHNTCRHRGSKLCSTPRGRFAHGRIVCPYHAWSYALSGELVATPKMDLPDDFRREDYALYGVPVGTWGGFLFVNLDERPASTLAEFLGDEATWTLDGRSSLPLIEGPGAADRALGVVFASFTASLFIVAHPDYVRSVRIMPKGPERVELTVDWLLPPGVAERHPDELERMYALGRLVVAQDGRVCELNQQGLRSRRHSEGVLMPQEHALHEFHLWLRSRLSA